MKYIVVGGGNGLGLAISNLLCQNNEVVVYDIKKPEIENENLTYKFVDLTSLDISFMKNDIENSDGLIYTAGIGRVDHFYNYKESDIERTITIDLTSCIKALTMASSKLMSKSRFECLVISSIAGLVSSPLFSVYSAAKAGVCKYVEAVNTEIEKAGFENRITNVVATSFKGTSFNGGATDLVQLEELSGYLVNSMKNRIELCKVNEELIDSILKRYHDDSKKFSLESYDYKMMSGRVK